VEETARAGEPCRQLDAIDNRNAALVRVEIDVKLMVDDGCWRGRRRERKQQREA
jgi:hypothetical protein